MSHSEAEKHFHHLMLRFAQEEDLARRAALEEIIWEEYGSTCAVCVVDMSGFTRITQRHGIVHYLSMITRMQLTAAPVIKSHGGTVVKFEADNCFAIFPEPLEAIRACVAMHIAFDALNLLTDGDYDLRVACGIDYGKVLMPHAEDFFGECVNSASKLGEDVAEAGEILVGSAAMNRVPPGADINAVPATVRVSGIKIEAYSISYP